MDSAANALHAPAFASPWSAISHAGRCGLPRSRPSSVRARIVMIMIKNSAKQPSFGLRPKLPPLLSSIFSGIRQAVLRGDDFGNWCSQFLMVIATERQNNKGTVAEDNAAGAISNINEGAATNQNCTYGCGCYVDDDSEDQYLFQFYADSFSRLLQRISLADLKMYAELCYLGNLTYHIPKIKEEDLLSCMGLRFVTSHLEMETTLEVRGDLSTDIASSFPVNAGALQRVDSQGGSHSEEKKADSLVPCGWYICDDDRTGIRYFVIQGSETIGSWQANLRFEPVQFEERDVLVHRGVYEVAKGIFEQLLPEVHAHLKPYRKKRRPLIRFTGHSLGGSVATLLDLMLLARGEAPVSALLPVVTYGSPYVMCGGEELMLELGLPKDHIQGIALHRDIVPKAFSATLPDWLIDIVKAINVNFRYNPCLNKKRLLYSPMGEFLILQPDESFSPAHYLLPPGPGLYLLTCTLPDTLKAERTVKAAQRAFLDYPYPFEILKDPSAYGWEGTIVRDHDMNSYLKCLRALIKYEQTHIKKVPSEKRNRFWWQLVGLKRMKIMDDSRVSVRQYEDNAINEEKGIQRKVTSILETTTESVKGYLAVLPF